MMDDASHPNEESRGLHRGTGEQERGGWFSETATDDQEPLPGDATTPAQQQYAEAVAAMNHIVRTFDFEKLPWVTDIFRTTAWAMQKEDPARASVLNNVGSACQLTYLRSGDLNDLQNAVSYYRSATKHAREDDDDLVLYACNLALALTDHATALEDAGLAEEATVAARRATEHSDQRDPRRVMTLVRLGNALKLHARLADDATSDDESIDVFREAVRSVAGGASEAVPTSEMLINLGTALLRRYERSSAPEDLDEGISHLRTGIDGLADGAPRRTALCHLANALRLRFQHNGHLSDLNTAINELLGVLGVLDPGDTLLGKTLWNLACTTVEHVDSTGEPSQLRRVLRTFAGATRGLSRDDPDNTVALAGYSGLLRRHFLHGAAANALDTAIAAGEAALETASAPAKRSVVMNSLTTTLITRYEHNGSMADLDRAAEIAEQAGDLAPAGSPPQHTAWTQLGLLAGYRYRRNSRSSDLDNAIDLLDRVLTEMPRSAPGRAAVATRLGRTLQMLHQKTGRRRIYRWAHRVLTEAATQRTAPVEQRLRAANLCGRLAAGAHRWSEALESFGTAVELIPLVTRGKHVVASAQEQRRWAWITADAAACAVESGEPQRAVELLEHGRSALLGDFLPIGGELENLRRDLPDLVDEAVRLRRLLDRPPEETALSYDGIADDGKRERLADAWNALLEEARTAHQDHLRLARFEQLAEAAEQGAVVLINLSRYRSDALVVFAERVLTVPLPGARPESAAEHAGNALEASRRQDSRALAEALDWVWHNITNPVLTRMGYIQTPEAGQRWPRIWWDAIGAQAFLPLHAATARTGESALNRVISSYTPSLQSLLRAQQSTPATGGRAMIAAGSSERVARELPRQNQILAKYWSTAEIASIEETGSADMLQMLTEHQFVHVCEPSTQYPAYPAAGLVLDRERPNQPLSLVELGQVALREAEFGFLGNCATADETPSAVSVPLGSTLGYAGFKHVISTLWEVDEESSTQIHADVYEDLFSGRTWDCDRSANALHAATRRLRAKYPDEPDRWAAHVHVGP